MKILLVPILLSACSPSINIEGDIYNDRITCKAVPFTVPQLPELPGIPKIPQPGVDCLPKEKVVDKEAEAQEIAEKCALLIEGLDRVELCDNELRSKTDEANKEEI